MKTVLLTKMVLMRSLALLGIGYASSALFFLFSLTIGVFTGRGREFLRQTCLYFGFGLPTGKELPRLPNLPIEEVVTNESFKLCEARSRPGNTSVGEIVVINSLLKTFKPRRIFEIGTFDGRTTMNMAINSPDEAKIFTLDLLAQRISEVKLRLVEGDRQYIAKDTSGERFLFRSLGEFPEKSKITQLYGDSAVFDYGPFTNSMDFIFIDGSHSYEYAMSDSRVALNLLRDGRGIIVWHDYGVWNGVTKALNQLKKERPALDLWHIQSTSLVILTREVTEGSYKDAIRTEA